MTRGTVRGRDLAATSRKLGLSPTSWGSPQPRTTHHRENADANFPGCGRPLRPLLF
jgi:hypothetical protein